MTEVGTPPRMSVRPLWSSARWLLDERGRDTLERVCAGARLEPELLLGGSGWVEVEQATRFLGLVRELVDDDEAFERVCSHRMREGYGPLLLVLPATTPQLLFRTIARTVSLFSTVSRGEIVQESRTRARLRYVTDAPETETRALCLTRLAAMRRIPTLFGLPPAVIDEAACVARGDSHCEYACRFYTKSRWVPAVLGTGAGTALAFVLDAAGVDPALGFWTLPALLGLVGTVWELRRTTAANRAFADEMQGALRELAADEASARREVLAFHQRQKEWGKLMEEQVAERTAQLQELVGRIESLSEARVTTVRGVSHDMRNPLTFLRLHHQLLRQRHGHDAELAEALREGEEALDQMERMLVDLAQRVGADGGFVRLEPSSMEVAPWVEILRRRVKALVHGKDISVSVFRRREAPEHIETDRLIFERVVDNLCSNAAKYTERGSIIIEVDGKPGFLTLQVSDTGIGIDPDRIAEIFEPGGTPDGKRAPRSLGLGLSVVVRLLAQVGGKLEVMSKPGQGTTFWAHFPVEMPRVDAPAADDETELADVVTIRKALSA